MLNYWNTLKQKLNAGWVYVVLQDICQLLTVGILQKEHISGLMTKHESDKISHWKDKSG